MLLHLSLSHSVHGAGGLPDRDPPQDRDLPCTVTSGRTVRINAFLLLVCSDVRSYRTVHLNDGKVVVTQLEVFGLCLYNRSSGNSNMATLRDRFQWLTRTASPSEL